MLLQVSYAHRDEQDTEWREERAGGGQGGGVQYRVLDKSSTKMDLRWPMIILC